MTYVVYIQINSGDWISFYLTVMFVNKLKIYNNVGKNNSMEECTFKCLLPSISAKYQAIFHICGHNLKTDFRQFFQP